MKRLRTARTIIEEENQLGGDYQPVKSEVKIPHTILGMSQQSFIISMQACNRADKATFNKKPISPMTNPYMNKILKHKNKDLQ